MSFSIVVLISGGGTTLKNLIDKQANGHLPVKICHVISSNAAAKGNAFATDNSIPLTVLPHREIGDDLVLSERLFETCRKTKCDLVVCGGFLRRLTIPGDFENRVINIHPSLVPAFCGKGFYGNRVHQSVLEYGCKISGCTVHFVDNEFDHGPIIAQRVVKVASTDSANRLQNRIFRQECELYPDVIRQIADGLVSVHERIVEVQN